MRVLTVLAVLALIASLVFAYISSKRPADVPIDDARPLSKVPGNLVTIALSDPAPYDYANANLDDWRAYTNKTFSNLGDTSAHAIATVTAADADTITIGLHGRNDKTGEISKDGHLDRFPRKDLTLDQLLAHADWTVFDITIRDDTRQIDRHTFHCKKLEYNEGDPLFPKKRTHVEAWYSSEVPAGGLVEKHETQDLERDASPTGNELHFDTRLQLTGFGTGSAVLFGTRPDGL